MTVGNPGVMCLPRHNNREAVTRPLWGTRLALTLRIRMAVRWKSRGRLRDSFPRCPGFPGRPVLASNEKGASARRFQLVTRDSRYKTARTMPIQFDEAYWNSCWARRRGLQDDIRCTILAAGLGKRLEPLTVRYHSQAAVPPGRQAAHGGDLGPQDGRVGHHRPLDEPVRAQADHQAALRRRRQVRGHASPTWKRTCPAARWAEFASRSSAAMPSGFPASRL